MQTGKIATSFNAKADAYRTLITDDPDTYSFITSAQQITHQMGGVATVHVKNWLETTVGSITATDCTTLDALNSLRLDENLLATTSYDDLLLDEGWHMPVTWKESDERRVQRRAVPLGTDVRAANDKLRAEKEADDESE